MNKNLLLSFFIAFLSYCVQAQITKISGPVGSGKFGNSVTVLTNGNYVVTDPEYDQDGISNIGAVYLYNGASHALISTLTGSQTNDHLGSGGISILSNGNFIVRSPQWDGNTASDVGAVTWGNGTTGISGVVSISNSLVGSTSNDQVGLRDVFALNNGNYVVNSPNWDNVWEIDAGAVTWGDGTTGVTGEVSASNSLVGSTADDNVGSANITNLGNGNYVVNSSSWDNASVSNAGAVTWGNGTTGVKGVVSTSNSLVGSTANDYVGSYGITALGNSNYVVNSPEWDNASKIDAGAVTWGNGTTGVKGVVSASNSLVGSTANDYVGGDRITALSNGNYVVNSSEWDNGSKINVGAATWGNGTVGAKGIVSTSNSLVGSTVNDYIGSNSVALNNGNYVVISPYWHNTSIGNAGAVTWGNGTTGVKGLVSASNSLVGSSVDDYVGRSGVTTLGNGNYVVISPNWDNALVSNLGAVTWGDGTIGVKGVVNASNSLVGSSAQDQVGFYGVTALSNGNYVVTTSSWDNASVSNAGAVTWGDGTFGVSGVVSASNSLVGSTANDYIGTHTNGVTALVNGNYVVISSNFDNGSITDAGAVTWGSGTIGVKGVVSASNSLVGFTARDAVGSNGITALSNGNYVVVSYNWDNASVSNAGAVTWGDGTIGVSGMVSISNSLVGSSAGDIPGSGGVTPLSNGNYIVISPYFNNASIADAGAITYGDGNVGVSGVVNTCNSVLGTEANGGSSQNHIFNTIYDYLLVGNPLGNFYVIHNGSQLADDNTTVTETIGSDPVIFSSDCKPIGKITPTDDASGVSGPVTMKVYVASTAPVAASQPYVRRYYDINPESGANEATAQITLFFSQGDFDDLNTNRGSAPALPGSPSDEDGIENLRITQNHGTSTTGTPGSYTGWTGSGPAVVLINPDDEDILWNSVEKRWEVTFNVTGFSGFFVHTNSTPLPVKLISFTGKRQENSAALEWRIAEAENFSHFQVQRSHDAKSFQTFETVAFMDEKSKYDLVDVNAQHYVNDKTSIFYRLKMVDLNGTYAFSRIIEIKFPGADRNYVYPNPFQKNISVSLRNHNGQVATVSLVNLKGEILVTKKVVVTNDKLSLHFDKEGMPAGNYTISVLVGEEMISLNVIKQQ